MKHVVMCSFGKDSMAMLYTMKEHKMPIDEIVYVKILFDDEISAELPEHEEWINNYAIPKIKQDFCIDVKVIQANYTYKDLFFKEITRGGRKGNNRGFPLLFGSWCHRDLKIKPVKDFLKQYNKNCKQYIGIAFDEIKRIAWELKQGNKMPLVDFGITEEQAFEICRKYKILSPAYQNFRRLGCWFCHKQGNKALQEYCDKESLTTGSMTGYCVCGYMEYCDLCDGSDKDLPCVKAILKLAKEKNYKINDKDFNFEKLLEGL